VKPIDKFEGQHKGQRENQTDDDPWGQPCKEIKHVGVRSEFVRILRVIKLFSA
jgi:hypothetical protein